MQNELDKVKKGLERAGVDTLKMYVQVSESIDKDEVFIAGLVECVCVNHEIFFFLVLFEFSLRLKISAIFFFVFFFLNCSRRTRRIAAAYC